MRQNSSNQFNAAIIQSDSLEEGIDKGLSQIGGLENLFEKDDDILINFGYVLPLGYPSSVNFNLIKILVSTLNKFGINKFYAISMPIGNLALKKISEMLGLDEFFKEINVKFVYIDGSNFGNLKMEELRAVKASLLDKIEMNGRSYLVPKILKSVKKYIVLTQVNAHYLFDVNLALNSLKSIILPEAENIQVDSANNEKISTESLIESDVNVIFDSYRIRKPDLTINDMSYSISGVGNIAYAGSKYHKFSTIIFGVNPFIVDLTTLRTLNFDLKENPLIKQIQKFELFKEILNEFTWNKKDRFTQVFNKNRVNLNDFYLKNISIVKGDKCPLCFKVFHHYINILRTFLAKDLNYIGESTLFIGEEPENVNTEGNIILFGDCAINSTSNYNFRTIKSPIKSNQKNITSEEDSSFKNKMIKVSNSLKPLNSTKLKQKKNKKILELPGCPPDIFKIFNLMIKYFGKSNMPQMRMILEILKILRNKRDLKLIEKWKKV